MIWRATGSFAGLQPWRWPGYRAPNPPADDLRQRLTWLYGEPERRDEADIAAWLRLGCNGSTLSTSAPIPVGDSKMSPLGNDLAGVEDGRCTGHPPIRPQAGGRP